jgi:hypothetical protein
VAAGGRQAQKNKTTYFKNAFQRLMPHSIFPVARVKRPETPVCAQWIVLPGCPATGNRSFRESVRSGNVPPAREKSIH